VSSLGVLPVLPPLSSLEGASAAFREATIAACMAGVTPMAIDEDPALVPESSLGVLTTWRPTNVCAPGRPSSRSIEMAVTAIASMTSDTRTAAGQIDRPTDVPWSVPTLVLMALLLRLAFPVRIHGP
jgi:hypothetical protein